MSSLNGFNAPDLTDAQFRTIADLVYDVSRLHLRAGKEGLVRARLSRRLRLLGMESFQEYIDFVAQDRSMRELSEMVEALTTNKTGFFREPRHFEYLGQHVLPELLEKQDGIRIWSAGCSSGEEPFTIGFTLCEAVPDLGAIDARILATDISSSVLERGRAAVYDEQVISDVPDALRRRYLECVQNQPSRQYRVHDAVRLLVRFARLNLMSTWPMPGEIDVIFCRNVMIYFDRQTQAELVGRLTDALAPGGYLFVGHAESLTGLEHSLDYVSPAIYKRPAS